MNLKSKIFISALALASMTAQAAPVANAPEIIKLPAMVNVLSDNGLWGVYEKASVTDGTLAPSGAVIVNMLTYQTTDVSHSSGISGATDITNDGKIIVGNVAGVPAYYSTDAGMWILLPLPQGYNGGGLNSVTPDGHYAVGYVNPASSAFKAYPVMYDLTTNSLIDLPNLPELDMQHENMEQNAVYQISADGRYLVGMLSQSYMLPAQLCTYVYDRQNATYKMIGFEPSDTQDWTPRWEDLFFVEGPVMSSNGKYVTGAAYIVEEVPGSEYPTEYNAAFLYDVEKDTFEVYNKHGENDYIGMNLLNDGTVICANPATNPYAYTSVRYGNYNIDLAQILRDNYGINFKEATGYLNTGKAISVSDDGMTILLMPDPDGDRVLMKLKEPIQEAAAKVNLLSNYAATPAAGSIMSQLKTVTVTFAREIEANSSASGIVCQSEDGTDKWNPLQSGGLRVEGSTATITFRSRDLREGVKYTLTIPAGTLRIKGDREMTNPEINITYTGRSKAPVKVTKVYPAEGASLAELNASTSPVLLTFDSSLKLAEGAQGELYRSGENTPFATLSFQMANDHQAYAYPTAAQHLSKALTIQW